MFLATNKLNFLCNQNQATEKPKLTRSPTMKHQQKNRIKWCFVWCDTYTIKDSQLEVFFHHHYMQPHYCINFSYFQNKLSNSIWPLLKPLSHGIKSNIFPYTNEAYLVWFVVFVFVFVFFFWTSFSSCSWYFLDNNFKWKCVTK